MSRSMLQRTIGGVAAGVLAAAVLAVAPDAAASAEPEGHVCSGSFASPAHLSGTVHGDVLVEGLCVVDQGPATVRGDLTVTLGAVLSVSLGNDDLSVTGDLRVRTGAAAFLGCTPPEGTCQGDTTNSLSAHVRVSGNLIAHDALAVQIRASTVGGDVAQNDGGGGENCDVPAATSPVTQVFNFIGSPVFSAYEDNTFRGDVRVSGIRSCWLGIARDGVGGDVVVANNQLADPDAIEIISDTIHGDLMCRGNSMAWDSVDEPPAFALYPRAWEPDTAHGNRRGQCVTAPALTLGGLSPGAF